MVNVSKVILLLILVNITGKIRCKMENLNYFLDDYEITTVKYLYTAHGDRTGGLERDEHCFSITIFGNEFVMDTYQYFQREDAEIQYVSKLMNSTINLYESESNIYEGHVRGINDSHVLGYFTESESFFGYIITDDVYVVEPYLGKGSAIVYKLTNVIAPGCYKGVPDGDFDCSQTSFFDPWINNTPPTLKESGFKLTYNKERERLKQYQSQFNKKTSENTRERNQKFGGKIDKNTFHNFETNKQKAYQNNNSYNKRIMTSERGEKIPDARSDQNTKDHHRWTSGFSMLEDYNMNQSNIYGNRHKFLNISRIPVLNDTTKLSWNKKMEEDSIQKSGSDYENYVTNKEFLPDQVAKRSSDQNRRGDRNKRNHRNYKRKSIEHINKNSVDWENADEISLKSQQVYPNMLSFFNRTKRFVDKSGQERNPEFESIPHGQGYRDMWEGFSFNKYRKFSRKKDNQKIKPIKYPGIERDKDYIELQCDLNVVIGPSFLKKFGTTMEAVRNIIMQVMLANKIIRKVKFERNFEPFRLTLLIRKIDVFADNVYSPFSEDGSLKDFVIRHRSLKDYCLRIGFLNEFLESGQLFNGYIPKGGGGACSKNGNILIISYGNNNTPVPMGLFFVSFMRALTRGLGANDELEECEVGELPNPMQVIKEYILEKEIELPASRSLFTVCNVREISLTFTYLECLHEIFDPLCGNGIVDKGEGEQCDCGPDYRCNMRDPCCRIPNIGLEAQMRNELGKVERGCTLVEGATCGMHQECCIDCQIMKHRDICYSGHGPCDVSICDGVSADCRKNDIEYSDGTVCSGFNSSLEDPLICKDMKCETSLCGSFGLEPCTCAAFTGKDCRYCCLMDGKCRSAGKELRLMPGKRFFKPDGTKCIGGMCANGKCMFEMNLGAVNEEMNVPSHLPKKNDHQKIEPKMALIFLLMLYVTL